MAVQEPVQKRGKVLLIICGVTVVIMVAVGLTLWELFHSQGFVGQDYHSLPALVQLMPGYPHPQISQANWVLRGSDGRPVRLIPERGYTIGFVTRGCACGADNEYLWKPFVETLVLIKDYAENVVVIIGEDSKSPIPDISKANTFGFLMGMARTFGGEETLVLGELPMQVLYDTDFKLMRSLGLAQKHSGKTDIFFVQPSIFVIDSEGTVVWLDTREEADWARPSQYERPSSKVLSIFLFLDELLYGG